MTVPLPTLVQPSAAILPHIYGDTIKKKPANVFRGVCCQLGCLPLDPADAKHEALINSMSHYHADVVALQEIGINFLRAGVNSQWKRRIGWNQWLDGNCTKTVHTWNTTARSHQLRQWGRTAIIALGPSTAYAAGAGSDPSHLGRWCWTCYRGTDGHFFHIYSFYHPCYNTSGQLSVYAQQR